MATSNQFTQIFADTLGIELSDVTPSLSQDSIASWDSLCTVRLVLELEDAFAIQFSPEELLHFRSVELIEGLLKDKGVVFA